MRRRTGSTTVAALLAAVALAACESSPPDPPQPSPAVSTAGTSRPPLYDPPLAFSVDGIPIGTVKGGYAVQDGVAYFVDEERRLAAVELETGKARFTQELDGELITAAWAPPRTSTVDNRVLVFLAYPVRVKGTGTTADRDVLKVIALDGADGKTAWSVDLPEDRLDSRLDQIQLNPPEIIGADADHVVLVSSGPRTLAPEATSIVFEARSGRLLWEAKEFQAHALDSGVVAGIVPTGRLFDPKTRVVGRKAADGAELWTQPQALTVTGLGAGLLALQSAKSTVVAFDTGRPVVTVEGFFGCRHDGRSTLVCVANRLYERQEQMIGYDSTSGQQLWRLPDEAANRVAPGLLATANGVVYVAAKSRPVILDARTGEDKVTDLAITPERVVPGFGLVTRRDVLYAYPATG